MAGVRFNESGARRIVAATKLVEDILSPDGTGRRDVGETGTAGWARAYFKVTSTTATSGLYPCSETNVDDPEAQTWTDGTAGEAWCYFLSGTPTLNARYFGFFIDRKASDNKPILLGVWPISSSGGGADKAVCRGRLTLSSTDPAPSADQTAKTTVYFLPYNGEEVSLYNGSTWSSFDLGSSGINVAVPSTIFRLFDVFVYDSSGLTLQTVDWDQSTDTITNVTAAAPAVVTSTSSHGLATGDLVGIASITGTIGSNARQGLNTKIFRVTNVSSTTFSLNGTDTSALAYTSGGSWYKVNTARATALVAQDGVWVKSGDTGKRYLGTCMTNSTSGNTEDTLRRRLCWNNYNRLPRKLARTTIDTWTRTATGNWDLADNDGNNRVDVVIGIGDAPVELSAALVFESSDFAERSLVHTSIGLDRCIGFGNTDADVRTGTTSEEVTFRAHAVAFLRQQPAAGYHAFFWQHEVQVVGAGGLSIGNTAGNENSGIIGTIQG